MSEEYTTAITGRGYSPSTTADSRSPTSREPPSSLVTATVPALLPVGVYTLTLRNPAGQVAVLPDAYDVRSSDQQTATAVAQATAQAQPSATASAVATSTLTPSLTPPTATPATTATSAGILTTPSSATSTSTPTPTFTATTMPTVTPTSTDTALPTATDTTRPADTATDMPTSGQPSTTAGLAPPNKTQRSLQSGQRCGLTVHVYTGSKMWVDVRLQVFSEDEPTQQEYAAARWKSDAHRWAAGCLPMRYIAPHAAPALLTVRMEGAHGTSRTMRVHFSIRRGRTPLLAPGSTGVTVQSPANLVIQGSPLPWDKASSASRVPGRHASKP